MNPLNIISKSPISQQIAQLNKLKEFKNSATVCKEFQSLFYDGALSFNCLLIFTCALQNRMRVETNDFHFIVWFINLDME